MSVTDLIGDLRRGGEVNHLAEAVFQFFQPSARVMAVTKPSQKAEPFIHVAALVPNVVLCDASVHDQKFSHAGGLGEEISRVAKLRRFHDHCPLKIEDIFRPK
jgi:hypothetical protein